MKRFLPVIIALIVFAAAALVSYGKICKGNACAPNPPAASESTSTGNATSAASVAPVIDNSQDFDISGTQGTSTLETGIQGKILLGPTCPMVQVDNPGACADKPYKATVNVETQDGTFVKSFTSNPDGTFYVPLASGAYVLLPVSGGTYPLGRPVTVNVRDGVVDTVNIYFDTGIR